ncbi:MAG: hypothetical protein ACTSRZ_13215 [Promethearchaeota archaeon]
MKVCPICRKIFPSSKVFCTCGEMLIFKDKEMPNIFGISEDGELKNFIKLLLKKKIKQSNQEKKRFEVEVVEEQKQEESEKRENEINPFNSLIDRYERLFYERNILKGNKKKSCEDEMKKILTKIKYLTNKIEYVMEEGNNEEIE